MTASALFQNDMLHEYAVWVCSMHMLCAVCVCSMCCVHVYALCCVQYVYAECSMCMLCAVCVCCVQYVYAVCSMCMLCAVCVCCVQYVYAAHSISNTLFATGIWHCKKLPLKVLGCHVTCDRTITHWISLLCHKLCHLPVFHHQTTLWNWSVDRWCAHQRCVRWMWTCRQHHKSETSTQHDGYHCEHYSTHDSYHCEHFSTLQHSLQLHELHSY